MLYTDEIERINKSTICIVFNKDDANLLYTMGKRVYFVPSSKRLKPYPIFRKTDILPIIDYYDFPTLVIQEIFNYITNNYSPEDPKLKELIIINNKLSTISDIDNVYDKDRIWIKFKNMLRLLPRYKGSKKEDKKNELS